MTERATPHFLVVGHINKPHGTKGEVFVWTLTDHPESIFAPGVVLLMGDNKGRVQEGEPTLRIETVRPFRKGVLVRFQGSSTRNHSEELRDTYLLKAAEELEGRDEDELFYHELLNLNVVTVNGTELGRVREAEVRSAAEILGVRHVHFLDYLDAELDQADPVEAAERVASFIRELRPQVIVTFDPFGGYGHPDHIAISQFAAAAVVRAAAPGSLAGTTHEPHRVQKLYYMAWTNRVWDRYQSVFKVLQMTVGDEVRSSVAWPGWSVTTTADAHDHWETVWAAVQCHESQMAQYGALTALAPEDHRAIWGPQEYYRVFSLVNGGRDKETDLFEGLR